MDGPGLFSSSFAKRLRWAGSSKFFCFRSKRNGEEGIWPHLHVLVLMKLEEEEKVQFGSTEQLSAMTSLGRNCTGQKGVAASSVNIHQI